MMKNLLFASLLIFSESSMAWDSVDTNRELYWIGINAIDYAQTMQISNECADGKIHETNKFLGTCPNNKSVNAWFVKTTMAHISVSALSTPKIRFVFQRATIAVSLGYIVNNYHMLNLTGEF